MRSSGGLSKGGRASGRHLQAEKEGADRTFCKKTAIGSVPKGGSKGGRRRPSRGKEPVYKAAPKDKTKQRLFLRALRPATQLHRRDGPANAPTFLGERKEYAGKGTGKTILYTGLHTDAQGTGTGIRLTLSKQARANARACFFAAECWSRVRLGNSISIL